MFDTNVYDKLQLDKELTEKLSNLINQIKIEIIKTHIQDDELSETKKIAFKEEDLPTEGFILDISKLNKAKLGNGSPSRSIFDEKKVPTSGGVWRVSPWGEATWGDGSDSGISINDIKTPSGNHAKDALIGTTASAQVHIFVTEDKRLLKKMKNLSTGCKTFNFDEFKKYVLENLVPKNKNK